MGFFPILQSGVKEHPLSIIEEEYLLLLSMSLAALFAIINNALISP